MIPIEDMEWGETSDDEPAEPVFQPGTKVYWEDKQLDKHHFGIREGTGIENFNRGSNLVLLNEGAKRTRIINDRHLVAQNYEAER